MTKSITLKVTNSKTNISIDSIKLTIEQQEFIDDNGPMSEDILEYVGGDVRLANLMNDAYVGIYNDIEEYAKELYEDEDEIYELDFCQLANDMLHRGDIDIIEDDGYVYIFESINLN
jgi:hypothetical protein